MRRVAIAGALAIDPDILILDEPTVGLDPKGKEELMNLLVDIQNKTHKSIIMITHDMNIVAKYAKRVLVMNHGKLVYDGNKHTLFENQEFLEKYNLDLPNIASVAKELKERQLIDFDTLPLTKEDLYKVIVKEEKNNEYQRENNGLGTRGRVVGGRGRDVHRPGGEIPRPGCTPEGRGIRFPAQPDGHGLGRRGVRGGLPPRSHRDGRERRVADADPQPREVRAAFGLRPVEGCGTQRARSL